MGDGSRAVRSARTKKILRTDRARKLRRIYSDLKCDLLLDIGCGTGALSVAIADACNAERTYGIDQSTPRIEQAAARGVHAVRQDVNAGLAFKSECFDSIHAGEVIDYLDDPVFFLNEVHRCLTPGGTFVISTANLASLHNRITLGLGRAPYPMRGSVDSETYTGGEVPPILSSRSTLFTLTQLQRLLQREGFEVLDTIPARSESVDTSILLTVLEDLLAFYPPLSYRNIIVCRKGTSKEPSGRKTGDTEVHKDVEEQAQLREQ